MLAVKYACCIATGTLHFPETLALVTLFRHNEKLLVSIYFYHENGKRGFNPCLLFLLNKSLFLAAQSGALNAGAFFLVVLSRFGAFQLPCRID